MKILLVCFLFISHFEVRSQVNDFIVMRKNGRTMISLYAGSNAEFSTAGGNYSGRINSIVHDSIFLLEYDIRQVPTHLGVYVLDTIAIYRLNFNYHEITYMGRMASKGFNWSASGGSLFGGGVVLTTVGLGTWLFTKPGTTYYAAPALVVGSAVLAGVGYLLMKKGNGYKLGGKYILEYVATK